MTTYNVSCIKQSLLMVFNLVYFIMWGYGASHDHCTCRLGMGLLVGVLYVMLIWTMEHENVNMTLWWYAFGYDHVLCCCDPYFVYALFYVH